MSQSAPPSFVCPKCASSDHRVDNSFATKFAVAAGIALGIALFVIVFVMSQIIVLAAIVGVLSAPVLMWFLRVAFGPWFSRWVCNSCGFAGHVSHFTPAQGATMDVATEEIYQKSMPTSSILNPESVLNRSVHVGWKIGTGICVPGALLIAFLVADERDRGQALMGAGVGGLFAGAIFGGTIGAVVGIVRHLKGHK